MLTILIPSYNHEKYIIDCIRAANQIDVLGKEIIIIDDGSVDHTVNTAKKYIDDERIKNVRIITKENAGLVSSLNLGLDMAQTEFICLVASDDILIPEGVVECVRILQAERECHFLIGGGRAFYDEGNIGVSVYGPRHEIFFRLDKSRRNKKMFFDYPNPILLQSSIFRVESLKKVGGWDADLVLDDYPMFIKLFFAYPRYGVDFKFLPHINVVRYRQHASNSYRDLLRQCSMVSQVITKYAAKEVVNRAISNSAAGYFLSGVRKRNFRDSFRLFSKLRGVRKFLFFYYVIKKLLLGVLKRVTG